MQGKAWNNKCGKCQRLHHLQSVCRSAKSVINAITEQEPSAETSAITGFMASLEATPPTPPLSLSPIVAHLRQSIARPLTSVPLPNHIHTQAGGWKQQNPALSPSMPVSVTLDRAVYSFLSPGTTMSQTQTNGWPCPRTEVNP